MNNKNTLCVAYAADDYFAKQLGISMLSLFQNNVDFKRIRVFIMDCGISKNNYNRLKRIAKEHNRELHFSRMENIKDRLSLKLGGSKLPIASYARLFISSVIPIEVDRVLYLDCDTLVCSSLAALWDMNLGNSLIAGVQDTVDSFFRKTVQLQKDMLYVNAGILLINLKCWREEEIEKQFHTFIQKFDGKVPHHDQGIINGVCKERRIILPLRYNIISSVYLFSARTIGRMYYLDHYYTQVDVNKAINEPAIIHFTTGLLGRPWEEKCKHPARDDYRKVVLESPWCDEPLQANSQKKSILIFIFIYQHMPVRIFETVYRMLSWLLHIFK